MDLDKLTLGARVTTQAGSGTVIGRRIGLIVEGYVDPATLPNEDAITIAVDNIGVPPETIRVTVRPTSILSIENQPLDR
jgi:hypothetical protein